jgi:hypothetical protein
LATRPDHDYSILKSTGTRFLTWTLGRNRSGSWAWRTSPCEASRIHKPSALVSFGLPNRLSFPVREHAMVPADRGTSLDRESVRVRPQSGLTRHLGERNVCKDYVTKSETKEIKDEPVAGLCSIDAIGGHAKSDQYGRSVCRLRHRSARAFSRQAFLRQQDSRYWALWNLEVRFVLSSQQRTFMTERRLPSDPTGTGLPHGFVLACWFRNAASPASDTSTHFLSGAASAT